MKKIGLILVDIQNDYFPKGRFELHEPMKAALNARKLLDYFRMKNMPFFHIQHVFLNHDAPFLAPDTKGINIHESVSPYPEEIVIKKHYPNSFRKTNLLKFLNSEGIKHVIVCGMMSHMCIDATVRAAVDFGFSCTVIEDACTSPDIYIRERKVPGSEIHDIFMTALGSLYATLDTADSFLEKLEKSEIPSG